MAQSVNFTDCEIPATVRMDVPPRTVNMRLRQRLHELLRQKHFSKSGLAAYCDQPPSWVSGILHQGRGVRLDDLDGIAAYFRLSIGELLGVSKPGELSGDEQRVVHAFRVLPPNLQDDILGILEGLSIGARFAGTSMPASSVSHVGQRRAPHGDDLPASNSFGPVDAGVVAIADEFARRVADLLRGTAGSGQVCFRALALYYTSPWGYGRGRADKSTG
jgi:transcriptional regulator with XRE-family HTH domain